MILKFSKVLVLSSVLLIGCSEYEREKIFNEIKEATMSKTEKLRAKRLQILERDADREIKRKIIEYYDRNNKPYTNISVRYYTVQDDGTYYTHPSYPNKIGYSADFVADIYYENLLFSSSSEISGEVTFFFADDGQSLNYEVRSPSREWISNNNSTQTTETSDKIIQGIGNLIKNN